MALFQLPFVSICVISTFSVFLILSFLVYIHWHWRYWTKRNIRGPRPQLFKGTFPKTNAGCCNLLEELHEIYLRHKSCERYVGIFTENNPKLFILDPQLATSILTQHFRNFHDNESSEWTSSRVEQLRICSPFVSKGEEWKQRRSELVPALSSNRLRVFYSVIRNSANKLITYISTHEGQPMNVKELANRFTAEFMANFIWGIEADAFSEKSGQRHSAVHEMANAMITQALTSVRYFHRTISFPFLRRLCPVRFFPENSDIFFERLANDVAKMRQVNANSELTHYHVIDHLLQLKQKGILSDIQIAGHTTTTLIDGFETAAIVIAHCLLLLSRNLHVQSKLREEILASGTDISYDEILDLPYLDQCLQETLRIFPPLATLFKLCTETITLNNYDNSELTLLPGDVVYISSYSFHHDSDYYERPEDFYPERFDADYGGVRKYRELGVFLPFGDGPRICPGMKLGLFEAKVAIAEVLRTFEVFCSECTRQDNKLEANSFLLTLAGNIQLVFKKL